MTIAGALATLSLMIAQPTDRPANDPPLIRIDQGELTGVADGDIAAFKNIPYAAPPVAEMRWRPPGTALR
ncbi:carboxylesterase family protein, partial [Brevundimonas aurantiaca]|uniref:carboxylesterase family protein n=1 Tax=Brevundimonas aurantiaca TaxID=74316 RepID=UPI0017493CE2